MNIAATPRSSYKTFTVPTAKARLEQCWKFDINWELYPDAIREGCQQAGKAVSMPPTAVLSGLLILTSFFVSHATVKIPGTDWVEPIILWISIGMPTGSGKSPLYKFLLDLVHKTKATVDSDKHKSAEATVGPKKDQVHKKGSSWLLEEATFEKMGIMMRNNHCKLLGLYDELSSFLTQTNLCNARGVSESHHLNQFLQIYNGLPWNKRTVTKGEANFEMELTSLTVGGFTQPAVAQSLIEMSSNCEKGFSTRFLWIFPKPCYAKFESLAVVKPEFKESLVSLFAKLWKDEKKPVHNFTIVDPCLKTFSKKYDYIQNQLSDIAGTDELLSGMLSKSKGLILRVAGVFHVLFCLDSAKDFPTEIADDTLKAAIDFVEVCCQHAAFIAGRGEIEDEIQDLKIAQVKQQTGDMEIKQAACVLKQRGRKLNITQLNNQKKFTKIGNIEGAKAGCHALQDAGLGEIETEECHRGTSERYIFIKALVPDNPDKKKAFISTLTGFDMKLDKYTELLESPSKISPRKRVRDEREAGESDQRAKRSLF